MIEIQSDTGTWYQRWGVRTLSLGGQVMVDWMVGREKGRGEVDRNAGLEPVCGVAAELQGGGKAETWGAGAARNQCSHCLTLFCSA